MGKAQERGTVLGSRKNVKEHTEKHDIRIRWRFPASTEWLNQELKKERTKKQGEKKI